jgi:hypothetical protein
MCRCCWARFHLAGPVPFAAVLGRDRGPGPVAQDRRVAEKSLTFSTGAGDFCRRQLLVLLSSEDILVPSSEHIVVRAW